MISKYIPWIIFFMAIGIIFYIRRAEGFISFLTSYAKPAPKNVTFQIAKPAPNKGVFQIGRPIDINNLRYIY